MTTGQRFRRRRFVQAGGALIAASMASRVQAQKTLPVVAFLHSQRSPPPEVEARGPLQMRLRELGWDDGKTFSMTYAYAEGREDRLAGLAAALVEKRVDLIVTAGGESTRAAKRATDTIPIVAIGPNLVAMGFASSVARPGGNVTGPSFDAGPGLSVKRLELLKVAVPTAKRLVYVRNTGQTTGAAEAAVASARAVGLELTILVVDGPADLDAAFATLSRNRPDALWFSDSPANISLRSRIVEFAARERVPAIYGIRQFAESGGLMSYGINLAERSRAAAQYVDKILRGAKPGDLPIEQATLLELVVNLKAARTIGLVMPQELLISAQQVIE